MNAIDRQILVLCGATLAALALLLVDFLSAPARVIPAQAAVQATGLARAVLPGDARRGFVDVTGESGVTAFHHAGEVLNDIRQVMAPGVGVGDLDGDDRLDLFLIAAGPDGGNALLLNRGGLRFEPRSGPGQPSSGETGMGCALADVDSDHDLDIYVTAHGPNRLYINHGSAGFEEVAAQRGVADPRWSTGAAFADYDVDGDLDLYVSNYVAFDAAAWVNAVGFKNDRDEPPQFSPFLFPAEADALYRNDGGRFTDVTAQSGIAAAAGKGMAVAFADLNDDDWPDVYVINDVSPDCYFQNRGDGTFADLSVVSGLADPRGGMGVAITDYDNDGCFDLFATHWQDESNVLYRCIAQPPGPGEAVFEDASVAVHLAQPSLGATGWGASWGDVDHDGDVDLLVVNGYTSPAPGDPSQCIGQPPMLFVNQGRSFEDQAALLGLAELGRWAWRGAALADLDDDGDLDAVLASNNGPVRILENRLASGHWIKVRPRGPVIPGTIVRVQAGGLPAQQRVLLAGSSYLSAEPLEAHFGLGEFQQAERIEVQFPGAQVVILRNVPADQAIVVEAPQ